MRELVDAAIHAAGIGAKLKEVLEFGPILGLVLVYLVVRQQTYALAGRDWDGFVLLMGGFVPVVLATSLPMWRVTSWASCRNLSSVMVAGSKPHGFDLPAPRWSQ